MKNLADLSTKNITNWVNSRSLKKLILFCKETNFSFFEYSYLDEIISRLFLSSHKFLKLLIISCVQVHVDVHVHGREDMKLVPFNCLVNEEHLNLK